MLISARAKSWLPAPGRRHQFQCQGRLNGLRSARRHRLSGDSKDRDSGRLRPRLRSWHFGPSSATTSRRTCPCSAFRLGRPPTTSIRCLRSTQGPTPFDPAACSPGGRKVLTAAILPNGVTPFIISKDMRLPTVDAWNFTVQRQLTGIVFARSCLRRQQRHARFRRYRRRLRSEPGHLSWLRHALDESAQALFPEVRLVPELTLFRKRRKQQLQLAAGETR